MCLAGLLMTSAGCAIFAPGSGHSGGDATLSDAVFVANRDTTQRFRPLPAGDRNPPPPVAVEIEVGVPPAPPPEHALAPPGRAIAAIEEPRPAPVRHRPLFGLCFSGGALGGTDFDGFGSFGITGGDYVVGPWRLDLLASLGGIEFKGESKLGQAFIDAFELQLDLTGRYYLTPHHTFVGVYGIAGLSTGTLFWDYAQKLPVIQDGELKEVSDDRLNYFESYAGAGSTIMQLRHLQMGGSLVGGVRWYSWHTFQGFENDELPATGFVRGQFELEFR
jgi:hypothetical protein